MAHFLLSIISAMSLLPSTLATAIKFTNNSECLILKRCYFRFDTENSHEMETHIFQAKPPSLSLELVLIVR